ncbi:MAG: tRNA pseudouridine synthase A [Mycoplasmataceae bacterium]|nr:MAG: tRNA pseudouridine synthase A [Mycoplasmataceae bacterium]
MLDIESNLFLVSISYDGTSFYGWSEQLNFITVQGLIQKRLSSVFKCKVKILASSRTDRGVHALDQNFTVRIPFEISSVELELILRKSLRDFIVVNSVRKVNNDFHPINDVKLKEYRYYIKTGAFDIFKDNYCWNFNLPIVVNKFRKIIKNFQGTHDFFNFSYCRFRNKNKKNTIRTIEKIIVLKKDDFVVIRIIAKGFVRYQIRAIVGESLHYYRFDKDVNHLRSRLNGLVDMKYKNIAPSSGLYLWKINFIKEKMQLQ